jgi:hypothetical protein
VYGGQGGGHLGVSFPGFGRARLILRPVRPRGCPRR